MEAISLWPDAGVSFLSSSSSDHAPMSFVLSILGSRYGPSSFKLQQMWVSHEGLNDVVKDVCQVQMGTTGLFRLAGKLKKIKMVPIDWNLQVFGRTENNIQCLEREIESLEC